MHCSFEADHRPCKYYAHGQCHQGFIWMVQEQPGYQRSYCNTLYFSTNCAAGKSTRLHLACMPCQLMKLSRSSIPPAGVVDGMVNQCNEMLCFCSLVEIFQCCKTCCCCLKWLQNSAMHSTMWHKHNAIIDWTCQV